MLNWKSILKINFSHEDVMSQHFPQTQLQHAKYHLANEENGKRYELCGSKELYPGYGFI